jgi:hypothetical protein
MTGEWPPEWGDPEDDTAAEAENAGAAADARLSEVTAFLAALPDPVMPAAVQARISAAISAESATRETAPPAATATADPLSARTLSPAARRAKVRRRREFRLRAISTVAVCLVIAGFGFLLTRFSGGSSSSSSADSSAAAAGTAGTAAASPDLGARAAESHQSFSESAPSAAVPAASSMPTSPPFFVTRRDDAYQSATLATEVRERLLVAGKSGASFGSGNGSSAPGEPLIGCVLHVTDDIFPELVDQATYQGTPVYVIATASHAWVVGRGCTATDPELITSVSLAGLPGNLSALGSVER